MFQFVIVLVCVLTTGCTFVFDKSARDEGRFLTEKYAIYRAGIVSEVSYDFTIDLTNAKNYSGTSKIDFLAKESAPLSVDFFEGVVNALRVNGQTVSKIEYNQFFINIPEKYILKGKNSIEIDFTHDYSKSGSGLYRFVDPVDKRVYLYSDFEPYDANTFAPVFDQPDLKATYSSNVTVPKDWEVVSSVREGSVGKTGDTALWTFPKSKKFSTYIYSLHAGPYKIWSSSVKTKNQTIPLRLMARQSMAQFVDPQEWFTTTQQGFVFFEDYFAYAYPYEKYDQVIVPDFNAGAMENVGAVTFNENRFITRGVKSRIQQRTLAEVILHEMAHMWFGNLVTMKWWNDIWLNESFATYAAYLALSEATPFKEASTDFIADAKGSAYWEDQLVTTHPIVFDVPNTDVVFANFDGITYGKGASVLKQLSFFIGPDAFKKGLQNYFSQYAFSNTKLTDFIGALALAGDTDLGDWQKLWLEKAQVNTIKANMVCEQGLLQEFSLLQTAPKDYATLRPHRTQVGLFTLNNNDLKLLKSFDVTYSDAKTKLSEPMGMACDNIQFIYPNYNDYDYVKIDFDSRSLETMSKAISAFSDDVVKIGSWRSLWDMVLDDRLSGFEYMNIFYKQAPLEKDADVLRSYVDNGFKVVEGAHPRVGTWTEKFAAEQKKFASFLFESMKSAPNADVQRIWFDEFLPVVSSAEHMAVLNDILIGKKQPWLKFPIDQDHRWEIVSALASSNFPNFETLIEKEEKRDASARGELKALAARASAPNLEVKQKFWDILAKGPTAEMPLGKLRYIVENLFPPHQEELQSQFADAFFTNLKELKNAPVEYLGAYARLAPKFCSTESVTRLEAFIKSKTDLPPNVIKRLKVASQETQRCMAIRARMESGKAPNPV
jgi:aminopeptidase N